MVEGCGIKILLTSSIQEAENSNRKGNSNRHDHSDTFPPTRPHLALPSNSLFRF